MVTGGEGGWEVEKRVKAVNCVVMDSDWDLRRPCEVYADVKLQSGTSATYIIFFLITLKTWDYICPLRSLRTGSLSS